MRRAPPERTLLPLLGGGALAVLILAAVLGRGAQAAPRADGPRVPVLVELYTSEGCSSCPPADAVVNRLAREGAPGVRVVPLAFHVDYWNDLGWPDPFSSRRFTLRQREYAAALGESGVYTPEAIVDGTSPFVGSDEGRALRELDAAARRPHATVNVRRAGASPSLRVEVTALPAVTAGDTAEVWVAVTEDGLVVDVPRGENAGRRLAHDGVVRDIARAGEVRGAGGVISVSIPAAFAGPRRHAVVFVQERRTRRVLGVGVLDG